MRLVLIGAAAIGLAACSPSVPDSGDGAAAPGLGAFFARNAPPRDAAAEAPTRPRLPTPLARTTLANGKITVTPPDGYCIDKTTVQNRSARGFALIASCQILTGGKTGASVAPMIATVTIGSRAASLPSADQIAEAAGAVLLAHQTRDGMVAAHLASGGQAGLPNGDERYWRAVFVQDGRSVGLAVYGPKGSAFAGDSGADMLARIRRGITSAEATPKEAAPRAGAGLPGVLGRLFNG